MKSIATLFLALLTCSSVFASSSFERVQSDLVVAGVIRSTEAKYNVSCAPLLEAQFEFKQNGSLTEFSGGTVCSDTSAGFQIDIVKVLFRGFDDGKTAELAELVFEKLR